MRYYKVETCRVCGKLLKGRPEHDFEVKDLNPIPDYVKQQRQIEAWREFQNKGE